MLFAEQYGKVRRALQAIVMLRSKGLLTKVQAFPVHVQTLRKFAPLLEGHRLASKEGRALGTGVIGGRGAELGMIEMWKGGRGNAPSSAFRQPHTPQV